MSEQERDHDAAGSASDQGGQQSRFLPEAHLEARDITAANVVSGGQHIAEQHIHLPGQKYAPPLHRPRRAEHFQDRVTECAWLLAHLHPGRIVTICGPGGMGKTALVAEVLWSLAPDDQPPRSFSDGLVFHSFYGRPEAAVALEQLARTFGEDPLPTPPQAAQRALSGKHVLLVLDGAEEAENLEQVLSVCASCAVLVTSRRRSDAADPALLLDLQRLPSHEAVAVVQAWQVQRETSAAVIERIVQLVGGLPLALRLVGSYLALHPDEADDYLTWLEEDLFEALNQGSTTRKSVPVLLEHSVARLSPDARSVLTVVGLLALAPFERELVAGILGLAPRAVSRALGALVDYGLLVRVRTAYEVSHPLVHTYARQVLLARQEESHQCALVERFVTVLAELFPEVEYTNWARCEQLAPHIQACIGQLEQHRVFLLEGGSLSHQAGVYLLARGWYEQAEELFKHALALHECVLEPDHVAISLSLDSLATLYRYQGKYEQAEPLFQRALAICERALPADHPNTATTLNDLALLYRAQGRYGEAEALYQRALVIYLQVLGPDHPKIALTLSNLANLYRAQGREGEAEALYQRAVTIKEQALGPDHPKTAITLSNLANLYRAQGREGEAEALYQRSLAIKEQALPPDHPDTAIALDNLAQLYRAQERYEEAEALYQRSLAIKEKVLPPDHPSIAITLNNLAFLCRVQGRYEEAEVLYQRSLAIKEQALPPDHPSIAITLRNYGALLRMMNRPKEAQTLEQRAKAIRARRSSQSTP